MHKITNLTDRAVGLTGGRMLAPGDSAEIELTKDELKQFKACEFVEVSDVGRSKGGSDAQPAEPPVD